VPTVAAAGVPCNRPVVVLNVAHGGRLVIEYVNALPSGSLAVGWNEYAVPTITEVAGVPEMTGARFGALETAIENAGSCALVCPSLTAITMLPYVPTWLVEGVPCSRPVDALNVAHDGRFVIENVSVLPSGSLADGWNEYAVPAVTEVGGVPEIVGGRFATFVTAIENAGSCAVACPSLTPMTMLLNVPMLALVGVPARRPVLALNVAQLGRFVMLYVNALPSTSVAVGVNEYCTPTDAPVGGVPLITGALFVGGDVLPTGP
jgi:hypothetical protein